MLVTQITEINKSRAGVYLDGQFAFVLYRGELRRFQIREGEELSEDVYREITTQILPKRARLRCLNLLQSRDYTKKQLGDKLRQGGYDEACIEDAVAYAESYGYIDDGRYAKNYIEYRIQSKSRKRLETDLLRRGVSKEVIEQAFAALEEGGVRQDEMAAIGELLARKNYHADTADPKERQRMYGFLFRRGYSAEAIYKALRLPDGSQEFYSSR